MLNEILERIKESKDLEEVLRSYGWQTFEAFVAWIFEQHGYRTELHKRIKAEHRYEIDVYAEKGSTCFLIECKKWRGKSSPPSQLKKAALKHKERVEVFRKATGKNCEGIIVTLLDLPEEIEGIKIIPIARLNSYLLESTFL